MERIYLKRINLILTNRYFHLLSLYSLSFLIPLIVSGPQILTGTLVNLLLILGISQFKLKEVFPILIFPSISAFLNQVLFGTVTFYLIYLIPFIVLSNLILVITYHKGKNGVMSIFLSSFLKGVFLFSVIFLLTKLFSFPKIFLTSMVPIQFLTALLGTSLATLSLRK